MNDLCIYKDTAQYWPFLIACRKLNSEGDATDSCDVFLVIPTRSYSCLCVCFTEASVLVTQTLDVSGHQLLFENALILISKQKYYHIYVIVHSFAFKILVRIIYNKCTY